MIDIQIANNALERANISLRRILSDCPKAVARAVNRTMDGMRTDAVRETTQKYFVKAKEVRSSITFRKATAGNLMGAMVSRGRRHSLADYQMMPKTPKPGKRTPIKGAVKREGGLKSLRGFLVKRSGGKYFPFYRTGYDPSSRQHGGIKSYISPSMPQIIKNEETIRAMERGAEERFSKRLDHEIMQLLGAFR